MKKKVVSLLLAAAMTTAALAGCGSSNGSSSSDASTGADSTSATSASASTDGEKKDAAGEKIAMITDSGDITDESFNQITWETVCAYGDANGVEYEYYKPAEDTDEERINSIDLAVSEGATVVVTENSCVCRRGRERCARIGIKRRGHCHGRHGF